MADEVLVELLRQGHEKFNAWRAKNPEAPIDLRGAQLAGFDLSKCRLEKADLSQADLRGTSWKETRLDGATLNYANLSAFEGNATELTGCAVPGASCIGTVFRGSSSRGGCTFHSSDLTDADLSDVSWQHAHLTEAVLVRAVMRGASVPTANFTKANLESVQAGPSAGRPANFRGSQLIEASLKGAVLDSAVLDGAYLNGSDLSGSSLRGASARATNFELADLRTADLRDLRPDRETRLAHAKVQGARIHRYTLEYLHDYGGLTIAERADMEIINDVARLRQNFSGVFTVIHAVALVLFLAPYIWFVLSHYSVARFAAANEGDPTLLTALLRFIVSGGREWAEWAPSWRVLLFLILLSYNALRAALLYKTKALELEELTTGLPSRFSFSEHPRWGRVFTFARVLFRFVLFVVGWHTVNFLMVRVPV